MTPSLFPRRLLFLCFLTLVFLTPLAAQDTRGSLLPDSTVMLMDGSAVEAQNLRAGSMVWTWMPGGQPAPGKVTAVRKQHSDSYLMLKIGDREFKATGSHRIALSGGSLVRIDKVKAGDKVLVWGGKGTEEVVVVLVRVFPATLVTYDLMIEGHRMFRVGDVIVGD